MSPSAAAHLAICDALDADEAHRFDGSNGPRLFLNLLPWRQ
jgi:hypothetical protein